MTALQPELCRGCPCLGQVEFFADLPRDKQLAVMGHAVRAHYKKDDLLFEKGAPVQAIYLIRSGKVKLTAVDNDGREQIAGIFSAGETIWEGVFMDGSEYPYSAVCVTPVDCCRIDRRNFEQAVTDPQIALRVIGLLSRKLHDANERNLLLSTSDPRRRLAGFLLYRSRLSASDTVTLRLEDIAGSVSLRPETVSRKLRELEKDGLIARIGQSGIRILRRETLRDAFDGN